MADGRSDAPHEAMLQPILARASEPLTQESAVELSRGSSYFLSGVMQGAKADGDGVEGTVNQDYRGQLKAAILSADSSASIIEPWDLVGAFVKETYAEGTPQSDMFRDDAHVAQAFGICVDAAAKADVVISYLPEASMGSAVELHAAHQAGRKILVVAPGSMAGNWVVRSYSNQTFQSIADAGEFLKGCLSAA